VAARERTCARAGCERVGQSTQSRRCDVCGFATVPVVEANTPSRGQEASDERRAQLRERASGVLTGSLEPGDELRIATSAHTRPTGTVGLEFLLGMWMFQLMHWYVVGVTDSRFIVLDCGPPRGKKYGGRGRPESVGWNERFDSVRVLRYSEGWLYTRLHIENGAGQVKRLLLARVERDESRQIAKTLGANQPD
jgi:hypothetical protein